MSLYVAKSKAKLQTILIDENMKLEEIVAYEDNSHRLTTLPRILNFICLKI